MHSDPAPFSHWLHNGELCDAESTGLSLSEITQYIGVGVFETIPIYKGKPFALKDHWMRLYEGSHRFSLTIPSLEQLRDQIEFLVEKNELGSIPLVRARFTVLKTGRDDSISHQVLAVALPPQHPARARVVTLPFSRNENSALVGIKTLNYGENEIALEYARNQGADEAIFLNTCGDVCEGIWSNLFVRSKGQWLTPPLSSGCLPGVTRQQVLALSDTSGLCIEEAVIPSESLAEIEAAFLTSSLREIQPVASIDGRDLDNRYRGEIDRWIHSFQNRVTSTLSTTH